jgi:hypothetical protein
MLLPA